ncbi:hypothetical protein [Sporosarcina sp. P29]|uniref:hypothetical protein n=1 Tax=Sporosarcina sp. P29 TaxID=2048252 RepID=UPI000C163575|nr:hypothetical protein [Sporosarcina sp. P29]PIC99536.1 hypothetical protein CSV68_07230 [Sporosarcina sp. P29]
MNIKERSKIFAFIFVLLFIVTFVASLYAFWGLGNERDFITWIGILSGVLSLTLACYFFITEKQESKKLAESIDGLKSTIEELKVYQENQITKQDEQNLRLESIEKELNVYQEKLSSTNLLSIFINRKKWE